MGLIKYKINLIRKMIVEQNSEFKAMSVLVRYWYKNFSGYELAKEAEISPPTAYTIIKKFEKKEVISTEKNKVKLNINNPFSYSFKLMYDSERILDISKENQNRVNHVFEVFTKEYDGDLLAFIIFGSVASNEETEKSDIDLLAIIKKKKEIDYRKRGLLGLGNINIIEKEKNEFENDYLLANDLVLNALMNGIVVFDNGLIRFLLSKPLPMPSYQVIMEKKERLDVLKKRLFALLKEEDYETLIEQLKLYIIEKARILFLQKNIIPSSKKFITDNMNKIDKNLYKEYHSIDKRNVRKILQKNV